MAVVIRLMRAGAKKRPFYRLVVADSRRQRDGRFLEIVGHYNPISQPYELLVHKDKVQKWLDQGATPSQQVASLLRSTGMMLGRASKPAKKKPATEAKPRKRTRPRKVTERKRKAKAARKAVRGKGGPKKAAGKK